MTLRALGVITALVALAIATRTEASAEETFTTPTANTSSSGGIILRGGAVQQGAPVSVIQRKKILTPFDEADKRLLDTDFVLPSKKSLIPLEADTNAAQFRLQALRNQLQPSQDFILQSPRRAPDSVPVRERPERLRSLEPGFADEVSRQITRQLGGGGGGGGGGFDVDVRRGPLPEKNT